MVSTRSAVARGSNPFSSQRPRAGTRPVSAAQTRNNHAVHGRAPMYRANQVATSGFSTALPQPPNGEYIPPPTNSLGLRPDWADWDELTIRVHRLPENITTQDLIEFFTPRGTVVYTEIYPPKKGKTTAVVRFSPPPREAVWHGTMRIMTDEGPCRITAILLPRRGVETVTTPENHTYPARLTINPAKLQFGLLSEPNKFMAMRTIESTLTDEFSFLVDLKTRKVEITFHCFIADPRRDNPQIQHGSDIGEREKVSTYRARIPFAHLRTLAVLDGQSKFSVVIPLQSPAILFKRGSIERSFSEAKATWSENDLWNRSVDIVYDTSWFRDDPVSLRADHHFVDLGRCTTYKLTFKKSAANLQDWETMKQALSELNISIRDMPVGSLDTVAPMKSDFWEIFESKATNFALLAAMEDIHLPFDARYQLEVCISQGFLDVGNLSPEFVRSLSQLYHSQKGARNRAMDLLTYVAESRGPSPRDESNMYPKRFFDPIALFTDTVAKSYYLELGTPKNCTWVRKVVVTPSTIYLNTPTPEPSNRVLRHFAAHADRFLRVQFTDELIKGRISSSPRTTQQDALFNRVHRTLYNGINIAGRHYEFLAYGNSQFRENGAYFFAPTDHLTCDRIRKWMGDVAHIRIVAKHAARLGQCFSTTKPLRNSPIGKSIGLIPDIERNGWCFTDGVGKISHQLAEYVAKPLRLMTSHVPSAFQFRLGGSKGVLVTWPDSSFNQIYLRPSQKKFEAQSEVLEIIKASSYSAATLNRQTITILSSLGISDSVFLDLQQKQIHQYNEAMDNPKIAENLLNRFVDQNGVTRIMAQMIKDGFMRTKEPFFQCILQTWRAWSLRLLREKARIVVEKGAFVLGCVDESCKLRGYRPNGELPQIFLQVPKPGDPKSYMVVTGLCIVGRNPSLHPGDIRVVEAVDVLDLQFLRDVVVFPATGDRDIPSMCSGGDLDGDDYFVIWDPNLIPDIRDYPPMKHEPEKPEVLDRDVEMSDLINFFTEYMKNDALSTIAHAHLAQSDSLERGPMNPKCVALAHLHSNAVDYPKSGRPAHLDGSLRPRAFPHFMEKPGRSYHSKRVLGQLYDVVTKVEFQPSYNGAFDERILRRYELSSETLDNARRLKRQHDRALRQIMNQREINTEFEMYTTFVMTKPRVGTEYQVQETMGSIIGNHQERFRGLCVKAAGSSDADVLFPFIAATYRVTWEAVQVQIRRQKQWIREKREPDKSMPLISFPWIFDQELGRIANSEKQYQLDSLPAISEDVLYGDEEDDAALNQLLGPDDDVSKLPKLIDLDEDEAFSDLNISSPETVDTNETTDVDEVDNKSVSKVSVFTLTGDDKPPSMGEEIEADSDGQEHLQSEEPSKEAATPGSRVVILNEEPQTSMDVLEKLMEDF